VVIEGVRPLLEYLCFRTTDSHYPGMMDINGNFIPLDTHGCDRLARDETPHP
jgi:hypothetical protein